MTDTEQNTQAINNLVMSVSFALMTSVGPDAARSMLNMFSSMNSSLPPGAVASALAATVKAQESILTQMSAT